MNFRFFINLSSPFHLPTFTPEHPKPQDSASKPISSILPRFPASNLVNLRLLLSSLWSLYPRPPPSPPPPPTPTPTRPRVLAPDYDRWPSRPLFRPYVAQIPWHGGVRAFLSQLFPRYGHYCGPNWSSGKDKGSLLWDRRPMDWLDFCCYCHDIGYDTHDQAKLLKADLAFLECLERPRMPTKGDARAAYLYRTMCVAGLTNILIPYRLQLVRLQGGPSVVELMSNLTGKNITFRQDPN